MDEQVYDYDIQDFHKLLNDNIKYKLNKQAIKDMLDYLGIDL